MKITVSFQTLILGTLATALVLATAVWALTIYSATYEIILRGFDQKLLALSDGTAVLLDGDGHAGYQHPYRIRALSAGPDGKLYGYDSERGRLLLINPEDGGAIDAGLGPMPMLRSFAVDPASGQIAGLSDDGLTVYLRLDDPLLHAETLIQANPVDELVYVDGVLLLRQGNSLRGTDPTSVEIELEHAVSLLTAGDIEHPLIGLDAEQATLLAFDLEGRVQRQLPVDLSEHTVSALARVSGEHYAAAASLLHLKIDGTSVEVVANFVDGYYSEQDPYFQRYVDAFQEVRVRSGLTYLYTLQQLSGDQIVYFIDGSTGDDHSPPGTPDSVPEESLDDYTLAQSRGIAFVSDIREWEDWGLMKVAASPIFGSSGQVVALAGADVDIGMILNKTRNALFAVLFVGAALLILAGSVSFRVARSLTRPLREIKDSALRIAAGYFGTRIANRASDEIGRLAQSLDRLSERLEVQAKQSQAYQNALTGSRMHIALEHALGDLVHYGPLPDSVSVDRDVHVAGTQAGALGVSASACVLWLLSPEHDALTQAGANARIRTLVTGLLPDHSAHAAMDICFLTIPDIHAIAVWDNQDHSLTMRCRGQLTLQLDAASGERRSLEAFDGIQLRLDDGQKLRWGEHHVLSPRPQWEAAAP